MNPRANRFERSWPVLVAALVLAVAVALVSAAQPMLSVAAALAAAGLVLSILNPFLPFLAFVVLFPFAPYLAHPEYPVITLPKLVFALALASLMGSILLRKRRIDIAPEVKLALAWSALAIASLVWATNRKVGAVAAASLLGMVALMALTAAFAADSSRRRTLVRLLLLQTAAFGAFGLFQFLTRKTLGHIGHYPDINYFITFRGLVRASSAFLHPNDFSTYLIVLIPLAAVWSFEHKGLDRLIGLLATVLGVVALALTFTRSAWIALALSAAVTLLRRYWRAFVGLALVLAFVAAAAFTRYQREAELFLSRLELTPDRSVSDRVWAYEAALNMIKAHPLLGVGIGQFVVLYPEFKPYEASWTAKGERVPMTVHNIVLEVASELGLAGLALFAAFVFLIARKTRSLASSTDTELRAIGVALACGLLAFFIQAQFNNQLYMEIGWIALGLVVGTGTAADAEG